MLRSKKSDEDDDLYGNQENIPLTDSQRQYKIRSEAVLEAEVLPDDTLVSIALRFNCTVADIKRLNKIQNNNEIFAFKVLKVPLTAHNILFDTLPKVHKSGSNSPRAVAAGTTLNNTNNNSNIASSKEKLEEKLLVASVSAAVITKNDDLITHDEPQSDSLNEPLLSKSQFRALKPPRNEFLTFNGSDCEFNWICLLILILVICVIIPLIYVYLVYEHPEKFNHTHSRYDDTELHFRAHFNDDNKINMSTDHH
ncbi:hypothetical protein PVAND_006618 [Polypedilum vanderplanki]|uniref:LysM domain-containing protein n=1 Tax=Polypedilum vanderplanki TaxID=319348 RepID=A0A9J6C481_POLVA|nr:hypothetical protein PVAND_006618 [Polypedilum vanderplanki]